MKRKGWLAASSLLLIGSAALAVKVGEPLYIRAKGTKMMESSAPTAKVVTLLQAGQQVKWLGADKANKQWHKVDFQGKQGVVFQSNLSPEKPSSELLAKGGGQEVDPQAFASSGAATKALSEAGVKYAKQVNAQAEAEKLQALEDLAASLKASDINARNKKVGIFVLAGEEASR